MHIGFLTPEYVMLGRIDGGLANYLRKISYELVERGHKVSIFVLSDKNCFWKDGQVNVHEIKQVQPIRWKTQSHRQRQLALIIAQVMSSRRLSKAVWKIHKKEPIDILQASSYMAPGYFLLKNGRIPIICRVSSYTPLWRSAYGQKRSFGEYISDWLEIRQVLDADASFSPSELLANTFARIEGYQPKVIRTPLDQIVYKDMDTSVYDNNLKGRKYILYFGTLNRIKGVDLLAEAIPPILKKYGDINFVFIGRDDGMPSGQKVFDIIRGNCKGYEERVHYYQALPKQQLYPIISNAMGVLLPSRVDNYPNACLEALSMGVPVIGTYNSSIDELVKDGETGFLAVNGSPASISNAIERLYNLTDFQRKEMKEKILVDVDKIINEDRIGQLIELYSSIIREYRY